MSNELLNLILVITSIITTIVLIITLGIMAWQTSHTARQTKLNTIVSYYQYIQNMNTVLFQDEEVSKKILGENKEDVMAFIIAMTISLTYQLHKKHLIDSDWWKVDRVGIAEMVKTERMRFYWERYKHFYQRDFVQFIEDVLQFDMAVSNMQRQTYLPSTGIFFSSEIQSKRLTACRNQGTP